MKKQFKDSYEVPRVKSQRADFSARVQQQEANVENGTDLDVFLNSIPKNVTIVPKIESPKGVKNIEEIIKKLDYEEQIVMLDHDDLFSNIKKENEDPSNFQKYIKILIEKCRENNVNLLRTIGVIFGTEEKRTTDYVK